MSKSKERDIWQFSVEVLIEFIVSITREQGSLLFIWTWPICRQRVGYHKHHHQNSQVCLLISFKKPRESLICILSTFLTIVHCAFEADMRLMAVGSRLCAVSFWERAQFGPTNLNYLRTAPEVYQVVCGY